MTQMGYRVKKEVPTVIHTTSRIPLKNCYSSKDLSSLSQEKKLSSPGVFPFTRGIYPTMYRGKLWTMREFAGYGTPEDTNRRFRYLIGHGETGLSTAFDYPTIDGRDADDPRSHGEIGRGGVSVSTLRDMEVIFNGIPLDKVTTSMTINTPAIAVLAMYFAVAESQGLSLDDLSGTTQNDMLKEFMSQKDYAIPPEPSVDLVIDIIKFCTMHAKRWHPVSISGYHIREAGATAVQELAFTIADGITYVEKCIEAGLKVDDFAPRLSFFWNSHNNFFEEIAKFRAARRMWAHIMKERFGAKKPESLKMRFHVQTSGVSLQSVQPDVNIARVAYQAMAAALGGCQSLHTNSYDEAITLPTEKAVRIAVRTQQVLACETGVADVADSLGGSYLVEYLTDEVEAKAHELIDRIEKMGGVIKGIESGFFLREIANSAAEYQSKVDRGEIPVVGVNCHQQEKGEPIEILKIPLDVEKRQIERLRNVKKSRDNRKVRSLLAELKRAAENHEFLMPIVFRAVKNHASIGEIMGVFKEVHGVYEEPIVI